MRRLPLLIVAAVILALGGAAAPASADVDDFVFESFHGDYSLDRDADGRSTLAVVETLVAVFPDFDQNRGIRRELVDTFDGHPTDLDVVSVTDETGAPRPYEEESDDGVDVLTIASDEYVHGRQTYVITYTQRNVTRYFADTDADEFYWDTNGTGWRQPFGQVTATVRLTDELRAAQTGAVDAASGVEGASEPAVIAETTDGFEFAATDLGPFENLTFAIGFEQGTFTPRDDGFTAAPWPSLSLAGALLAALAAVWAFVVRRTRLRDAPGRGIIVPEYVPPKNEGILLSSVVSGKTSHAIPAQILALAVAGRVRVVEVAGSRWSTKPGYELEYVQTTATGREAFRNPEPSDEDLGTLHALFGAELTEGERRPLAKADARAVKRLTALTKRVRDDATAEGYRRRLPAGIIAAVIAVGAIAATGAFIFGVVALAEVYGGFWPLATIVVGGLGFALVVVAVAKVPLDAKGVALRDYLKGLDLYITLAEADRIRYLQSPQGAERTPVATDDREQLLKLNERLLPWAVLLGREKAWTAELGRYYEELGTQPSWYVGSHPFNAAVFAGSIGSVTTSVTSTYSASSGGSGGGASSGGGGGGGGGGGV